mgnify:CR=1 FL=1
MTTLKKDSATLILEIAKFKAIGSQSKDNASTKSNELFEALKVESQNNKLHNLSGAEIVNQAFELAFKNDDEHGFFEDGKTPVWLRTMRSAIAYWESENKEPLREMECSFTELRKAYDNKNKDDNIEQLKKVFSMYIKDIKKLSDKDRKTAVKNTTAQMVAMHKQIATMLPVEEKKKKTA